MFRRNRDTDPGWSVVPVSQVRAGDIMFGPGDAEDVIVEIIQDAIDRHGVEPWTLYMRSGAVILPRDGMVRIKNRAK